MQEVLLFNQIFNLCTLTKGGWYEIEKLPLGFKAYWSFQFKTWDVRCLETKYKSHALQWNLNKLNLHRFLDFVSTRVLPKTCPAFSWGQAELLVSWVNRFPATKTKWKVSHVVHYLPTWITCACESNVMMIVVSLACAFTWLLWHQMDLTL